MFGMLSTREALGISSVLKKTRLNLFCRQLDAGKIRGGSPGRVSHTNPSRQASSDAFVSLKMNIDCTFSVDLEYALIPFILPE